MNWNEITSEEAQNHPKYGFGGGLYFIYIIAIGWCLHSIYLVILDTNYILAESYGYENFTVSDFASTVQVLLTLPFLYLAPRMSPIMPSVAVSLMSVNWVVWFTYGMITPLAVPTSIVVTLATGIMVVYLMFSTRVNVTYLHRIMGS